MRRISVDDIQTVPRLERTLYHETGYPLLFAGSPLGAEEIALLRLHNIGRLYEVDEPGADALPLCDDAAEPPSEVETFRRGLLDLNRHREAGRPLTLRMPDERLILRPAAEVRGDQVADLAGHDRPFGLSAKARIGPADPGPRPATLVEEALAGRERAIATLRTFLDDLQGHAEGEGKQGVEDPVGGLAAWIVEGLLRDRSLALALAHLRGGGGAAIPSNGGFLATHAFNVAVVASGIALEMGYHQDQILELAYGALLHDVGMLRLPEELIHKVDPLTDAERESIRSHPYYALQSLRCFAAIPRSLPAIAFQEHERTDRTGYPLGLDAPAISTFAKIVATADVYDALTSHRPWRSAHNPHAALREIVQMAARRALEPRIVRALIQSLSLWPVGQWVKLSDGRVGCVVAVAETDSARPVVRLIDSHDPAAAAVAESGPTAPATVDLVRERGLRIAGPVDRVLSRSDLLAGF